jgi:hypothetical protein
MRGHAAGDIITSTLPSRTRTLGRSVTKDMFVVMDVYFFLDGDEPFSKSLKVRQSKNSTNIQKC